MAGHPAMHIESEELQPDGSAWTALVRVRGVLYVASFVAEKLTVRLAPYKHAPRRPRWAEAHVQRWAEKRVRGLPQPWHELHRALYAQP